MHNGTNYGIMRYNQKYLRNLIKDMKKDDYHNQWLPNANQLLNKFRVLTHEMVNIVRKD